MKTTLHAQPYDLAAAGFYFESAEEYAEKSAALRNEYGDPVEGFEIQFIDGDDIDCAFAQAVGLFQGNIAAFFTAIEEWEDGQKIRCIIAVGECNSGFNFETDKLIIWTLICTAQKRCANLPSNSSMTGISATSPRLWNSTSTMTPSLAILASNTPRRPSRVSGSFSAADERDFTRKPLRCFGGFGVQFRTINRMEKAHGTTTYQFERS